MRSVRNVSSGSHKLFHPIEYLMFTLFDTNSCNETKLGFVHACRGIVTKLRTEQTFQEFNDGTGDANWSVLIDLRSSRVYLV